MMASPLGNTLEKLLFEPDNEVLPVEIKSDIRKTLIRTVCSFDGNLVANYTERLYHLKQLVLRTPDEDITSLYPTSLKRFLSLILHNTVETQNMELEPTTRLAYIRFAKVFTRLCQTQLDCSEIVDQAIAIMISLINKGRKRDTDKQCIFVLQAIQAKYASRLMPKMGSILYKIWSRIWQPGKYSEAVKGTLQLVRSLVQYGLLWEFGATNERHLVPKIVVALIGQCTTLRIPGARAMLSHIITAGVDVKGGPTLCLVIYEAMLGPYITRIMAIQICEYLVDQVVPIMNEVNKIEFIEGMIREATTFQREGRPELLSKVIQLAMVHPRLVTALDQHRPIPEGVREQLRFLFDPV